MVDNVNFTKVNILYYLMWIFVFFLLIQPSVATPFLDYLGRIYFFLLVFFSVYFFARGYIKKVDKKLTQLFILLLGARLYLYFIRFFMEGVFPVEVFKAMTKEILLIEIFTFGMLYHRWIKLRSLSILLYGYVIINYVTILLYPDGMISSDFYDLNWFLGYKNAMIRTMLPALVLNIICSIHDYGKIQIKDIILFFIILQSVILADSSTSLVMVLIFAFITVLMSFNNRPSYINIFNIFVGVGIVSVIIAVFGFQNYFSEIYKYLNRDSTLSGRIYIWEFVTLRIIDSPLFGFGFHTIEEWRDVIGFYEIFREGTSHPHNFLLFVLLQGGIVFLTMLLVIFKYISTIFEKKSKNNAILILTTMYIVFFVEGITESLTGTILFYPLLGLYFFMEKDVVLKCRNTSGLLWKK